MKNQISAGFLAVLLTVLWTATIIAGCAAASRDPFEARLSAMSDAQLISYYHGIEDRLKDIQAGTRETDRQGAIRQDDHLARMPYVIGGEAWELARQREKVVRELARRGLRP